MRALSLSLLFLLAACGGRSPAAETPAGNADAARALLLDYQQLMRDVAAQGSVDALKTGVTLLETRATGLRDTQQISAAFHDRFARLLHVTRLLTEPETPEAKKEIEDFAWEATRQRPQGSGMAAIAPAIIEELLSLHLLLDPQADRAELRKKYFSPDR